MGFRRSRLTSSYVELDNSSRLCYVVGDMKPFIPALMEKLIPIMMDPNTTRMLAENVSVAIGRLGCACPDVLAPSLDTYAHTWCARMKSVLDNNEKLSACLGMNQIIKANPQGLVNVG